jgi:tetratricopeptide (TPR) repeat protein
MRLKAAGGLEDGAPGATLEAAAQMLGYQALYAQSYLDSPEVASGLVERGLRILERPETSGRDTRSAEAFLWYVLGMVQRSTGREEYRQSLERSLVLARTAGDRWEMWCALIYVVHVALNAGEYDEAREKAEECIAIGHELGNERAIAVPSIWLSWIHVLEGRVEEGVRLARSSLLMVRRLESPVDVTVGLLILAAALVYGGKYAESQALFEERLVLAADLWVPNGFDLCMLGWAELQQGKYTEARSHLHTALDLARDGGQLLPRSLCQLEAGRLAVVDGAHADARDLLLESIRGLEASVYRDWSAKAQAATSYAARGLGNRGAAQRHVVGALRWAAERRSHLATVEALPAAALLLLDAGDTERAIEVHELARTFPYVANSQWYEDVVGHLVAAAATELPDEVVAAAKERGRARDALATCRELADEFDSL